MDLNNYLNKEISFGTVFPDKLKFSFYTDLASLLESSIDIQRAINLLIEEQSNKKVKQIFVQIASDLVVGISLSESMYKVGCFSPYEFQSVTIGEETGRLVFVLKQLSVFFDDKVRLKRQLVGVFTYPSFVIAITIGVVYFMLSSVVPMFKDVFKQFGQELPALTQKIIWLSNHFSSILFISASIIVSLVVYFYVNKDEVIFKDSVTKVLLRIPVFGELIRKIYIARMCQSFALLLSSKTPLVSAINMVAKMIDFYPIEVALVQISEEIKKGESFHVGLSKFTIFDNRLISLIKIAEEINGLDVTFEKLSKQYQEDVDYRTKLIGTIVEPSIIVIIGVIVGLIMISMYMPMFNLSNVIK